MQLKNKTEVSECELQLEIEVGADDVTRAINDAYREFAKVTEVPGFRKGKAPRQILARYVSEDRVKEHAAESLVPPALADAVKEAGVEPFAHPDVEIVSFEDKNPMVFTAKIPLPPKTELGTYVGLKIDKATHVITDEQVEKTIEDLRERTATYETVEGRPVQQGDRIMVQVLDESNPNDEEDVHTVTIGENLPSFDEGLLGMNIGDVKVISVEYPEDHSSPDLAGKTVPVRTSVLEIREKTQHELNDEWAKLAGTRMGREIESLDQMRKEIRDELEKEAVADSNRLVEAKIVQQVIDNSKICYPEIMRTHEAMHRIEDMVKQLERMGTTLEEYLSRSDLTADELRERVEQSADRDLKAMLVLSAIAEKENISVEDEEIEEEIKRQAEQQGVPVESFKAYLDKTDRRDEIAERLFRGKILDFLVNASNINSIGQTSEQKESS